MWSFWLVVVEVVLLWGGVVWSLWWRWSGVRRLEVGWWVGRGVEWLGVGRRFLVWWLVWCRGRWEGL